MFKKFILIIFASVIFFMPVQNGLFPNQVDAFASKLMSISAKKMAKEVAKDIAVESASNFALNEAFKIADNQLSKYSAVEEAYKIVCLHETSGSECDKPVAIKKDLSESDKTAIGNQAEIELDKLVSVDGKGFSRWQKFLDWFAPIWVSSAILAVITYAIDSDVRTLFNDAGYNALVALGFIKPVTDPTITKPFESVTLPPRNVETGTEGDLTTFAITDSLKSWYPKLIGLSIPNENLVIETEFAQRSSYLASYRLFINDVLNLTIASSSATFASAIYGTVSEVTTLKNGVLLETVTPYTLNSFNFNNPTIIEYNLINQKLKSIRTRTPYLAGGFYYTDVLYNTVEGDVLKYQIKHTAHNKPSIMNQVGTSISHDTTAYNTVRITLYQNQLPFGSPYEPYGEEEISTMEKSRYEKDGNIALVPPVAIPMTQISTGKTVTVSPNPTPNGEPIATNEDGETVPEEDISLGDPVVTPSPNGTPQVTPQPTPSNPTPEPMPLTPTPPIPPPPPVETLPPVFPEGESCDVGLKLPRFMPLLHTISDAFPFSIPFDLKDGFDAIFAEMGSEKPEFNYKFNFMGEEQSWKITIPDYFDDWKNFTDSFLIFIFDVGIIYAIYRFMGGGN